MWQKAHQEMKAKNASKALADAVRVEARTSDHSMILDNKRTQPLITKAYNAFRQTSMTSEDDKLLTTDKYKDEQQRFRETTMSGLRHAQKLMDSTQVQTIDRDGTDAEAFSSSLPNLVDPKMSLAEDTVLSNIPGAPTSEEELLQKINLMQEINTFTEGYTGQPKAMNRLSTMVRGTKPSAIRKAAIVDINRDTSLPANANRRKNKNDFYRFLLSTNQHGDGNANKINNDVFIPRSILKKSYVPGSIKEQRLEAAAEEFFEYQLAMQRMKRDSSEEYLGKYEVVFGQHLDSSDLQLSPKVKSLVQDKMQLEQIFNMPADTPSPQMKDAPLLKSAAETAGMPDSTAQ